MSKKIFISFLVAVLMLALAASSVAAQGPPDDKPGGGGGKPNEPGGGGKPDEPGGGSHTETQGNNLSFPALLADNYAVVDVTEDQFNVEYDGDFPGIPEGDIQGLIDAGPWYPQKTEGNVWQADYAEVVGSVDVDWIDWGDAIEAVNPKLNRPYRLELVLYEELVTPMIAYEMAELEYPSSSNELQGTNKNTYESYVASVASDLGNIVVQKYEVGTELELTWNGTTWEGADQDAGVSFGVENNVGGKLIYGASNKGWKPTEAGSYRITFYLDEGSEVNLSQAQIGNYNGDGATFTPVTAGETNTPTVDVDYGITYVDVTVVAGGGGGGH